MLEAGMNPLAPHHVERSSFGMEIIITQTWRQWPNRKILFRKFDDLELKTRQNPILFRRF
jgi:hypothetical protein